MIDRVLLDGAGRPLLSLYRESKEQALLPLEENLPEITPAGRFEDVAGTGVKIYVGGDQLTSSNYSLTLGTYGQGQADNFALQRTVMAAVTKTRAIQRGPHVLPIVRFAKLSRTLHGGAQFSGKVTAEFVPASAYWLSSVRRAELTSGRNEVFVAGQMRVYLRLSITAGGSPVTNPAILSDAGMTRWLGTIPVGSTLAIDARAGQWEVSLNGRPEHLKLTGPQPYLEAGQRSLTLTAAGATATAEWQEGEL